MYKKKKILLIIPAKKISKRLNNKNMAMINNRPLLEYSLNAASKSFFVDKILVSTDCKNIYRFCKKKSFKTLIRPQKLGGETPILKVYQHAYKKINQKFDVIYGYQVDHPDRNISVDLALKKFFLSKANTLFSKDNKGKKNGAHYIFYTKNLYNRNVKKIKYIQDNCTNIHTKKDLKKAEQRIKRKIK